MTGARHGKEQRFQFLSCKNLFFTIHDSKKKTYDSESSPLLIGTKTFNALATSSLRLDCSMDPEIGPNCSNFNLDTEVKSLGTKIFIKKTAKSLADQPTTNRLTRYDILSQLRQLRTKFHHSSTYLCCRASNEETDDLMAKPYTIFTLADYDSSHEDALYRIGSQLFQLIATSIFNNQRLTKDSILDLLARAKQGTDVHRHLESIIALFDNEVCTRNRYHRQQYS